MPQKHPWHKSFTYQRRCIHYIIDILLEINVNDQIIFFLVELTCIISLEFVITLMNNK